MTEAIYGLLMCALGLAVGFFAYRLTRAKPADFKAVFWGVAAFSVVAIFSFAVWVGLLENVVARKWGGTMTLNLPQNAQLMNMTWKEDSVWYLYYDPASGNCFFKEDSRHGLIEGGVIVKTCNPMGLQK